jgi:metal-sulfur cluster biosynthetic enzyme
MIGRESVFSALGQVDDPELPVSLIDLGLIEEVVVREDSSTEIVVVPTMPNCPFKGQIIDRITEVVSQLPGVGAVTVTFSDATRWTKARISEAGRHTLVQLDLLG